MEDSDSLFANSISNETFDMEDLDQKLMMDHDEEVYKEVVNNQLSFSDESYGDCSVDNLDGESDK